MDLIAALSLGILGSMHCIGMCGPLVIAIPSNWTNRWSFIIERMMYNVGRLLAYAAMGAVLGLFGTTLSFAGIQQNVSVILGISLLLTVVVPFSLKSRIQKYSPLTSMYLFVKNKFHTLFQKRGMTALFLMGFLNGLLPCGLVYTALIGATAVGEVGRSALFMTIFGFGTVPALLGVSLAGKMLSLKYRLVLRKTVPLFSVVIALILILRGMNLGIPMLSPKVQHVQHHQTAEPQTEIECCE